MFNLTAPDEGEFIDADWLDALVQSVNAAQIKAGDDADVIPTIDEGGTSLWLSDLARFQLRHVVVATLAPAATVPSGTIRRCYWGTFRWLDAVAIDDTGATKTIDFDTDPDNDVVVPFFNPYTSGPSAGAGKLIWVAPTPWGWALAIDECA